MEIWQRFEMDKRYTVYVFMLCVCICTQICAHHSYMPKLNKLSGHFIRYGLILLGWIQQAAGNIP